MHGWVFLLAWAAGPAVLGLEAPTSIHGDEPWVEVAFESERWQSEGVDAQVLEYSGKRSLLLRSGLLWLPDVAFLNGEIEFDLAFSEERGYIGAAWRIQDPANLEHFYLRPHQSGNPDSCQYTPVHNGSAAWQLFPESAASLTHPFERWMTVRLVVWESVLQVFVDSREPQLVTRLRRSPEAGGLGLQVPGFGPAYFSGFRYRALGQAPPMDGLAVEESLPGRVREWLVSSAFAESALEGLHAWPEAVLTELTWSAVESEASGVTNLARVQAARPGADTCFARVALHAATETRASIDFGFSDRVRVYHDRGLVYTGDDTYRSRDYRFLGTMGLHDRVTLPLHKGENELLFAVSESFGGWGVIAALEAVEGVRLE